MSLGQIQQSIRPLREALLGHPIYHDLRDANALRGFMRHHVFAVWDFMSLLKALQRQLSCLTVPWLPPVHRAACRLINEIVLAEESDEDGQGGYASHFELYHRAMTRFEADTSGINGLLNALSTGQPVMTAIQSTELSPGIQRFVRTTFEVIESRDLCRIAAAFTFGREDLLPGVFQKIVDQIQAQVGHGLDDFQYYLQRHIDLDGGDHGPMASQLITMLCGDDPRNWQAAEEAAVASLQARLSFWDDIHAELVAGAPVASTI